MSASTAKKHPSDAFHTILLPSLPAASQNLLLAVLDLMQAVTAFAERNAMPPRKLARTLGIYVFGLAPRDALWKDWQELDFMARAAGDALEGCLRAYLRTQKELPPRLRDVIEGYPAGPNGGKGKQRAVVRIEIESRGRWGRVELPDSNDQRTGRIGSSERPIARRRPLELMKTAFELGIASEPELDDGAQAAWQRLKEEASSRGLKSVLSSEIRRILDLVNAEHEEASSPTPRLRSISAYDSRTASPALLNGTPVLAPGTPTPRRIVTPSWNDFATSGFSNGADEFGLVGPDQSGGLSSSTAVNASSSRSGTQTRPSFKLVGVDFFETDEELEDLWLDTLVDDGACASWPSFVFAELSTEALAAIRQLSPPPPSSSAHKLSHILISERLISIEPQPAPLLDVPNTTTRPSSVAGSTMSRRWRRASSIFTISGKSRARDDDEAITPKISQQQQPQKGLQSVPPTSRPVSINTHTDSASELGRASSRSNKRRSMFFSPRERDSAPPLPTKFSLESLRAASASAEAPLPMASTGRTSSPPPPSSFAVTPDSPPLMSIEQAVAATEHVAVPAQPPTAEVIAAVAPGHAATVVARPTSSSNAKRQSTNSQSSISKRMLAGLASVPGLAAVVPYHQAPEGAATEQPPTATDRPSLSVPEESPVIRQDTPVLHISKTFDAVSPGAAEAVSPDAAEAASKPPLVDEDQAQSEVKEGSSSQDIIPATVATLGPPPALAPEASVDAPDAQDHPSSSVRLANARGNDIAAYAEHPPQTDLEQDVTHPLQDEPTLESAASTEPLASHAQEPGMLHSTIPDETTHGVQDSPTISLSPPPPEPLALAVPPAHGHPAMTDEVTQNTPTTSSATAGGLRVFVPRRKLSLTYFCSDANLLSSPPTSVTALPASPPLAATSSRSDETAASSSLSPAGNAAPRSPTPSGSSGKSTSKKLLDSVGGFLRRKSSSEKEQNRLAREEKAQQKEEVRLRKLEEEETKREAKTKKAPQPVSSVKKRVQEIEAETGIGLGLATSPSRRSLAQSSPTSATRRSSLAPAPLTLPPQEPAHHDAKLPATLEALPSALPTPTPSAPGADTVDMLVKSNVEDDPFLASSTAPSAPPTFALPPAPAPPTPVNEDTAAGEALIGLDANGQATPVKSSLGPLIDDATPVKDVDVPSSELHGHSDAGTVAQSVERQ